MRGKLEMIRSANFPEQNVVTSLSQTGAAGRMCSNPSDTFLSLSTCAVERAASRGGSRLTQLTSVLMRSGNESWPEICLVQAFPSYHTKSHTVCPSLCDRDAALRRDRIDEHPTRQATVQMTDQPASSFPFLSPSPFLL